MEDQVNCATCECECQKAEFLQMLTSQANELTEVSGKKTITVISDANVRRALDLLAGVALQVVSH